ncbi:MAG: galactose-1-phosphate uridylyltransferase, partial [Lachnospiraceae bacterium]|nr:galactose-1-phosphate uridylyltransferase [Lachnospiraceae bacterium]
MIQDEIRELVGYGLRTGLVEPEDEIYTVNRLLELFGLDSAEAEEKPGPCECETSCGCGEDSGSCGCGEEPGQCACGEAFDLERTLGRLVDYACSQGIMTESSIVYRDLFDTKIMGLLMPRPSQVIRKFREIYREQSPRAATDYYYKFSQDSDYIRRYRIAKDMKWVAETPYGDLDITINLSKPEKDPKAIAAAKNAKQSGYPKCLLCWENEGYAGRVNHPARQNHRIIPVTING